MRKLLTLFAAVLLLVGAAACGASGGSDTKTTDKTTTTAKELLPTTSGDKTTTSGGGGTASGSEADYTKSLSNGFTSGDQSGGDLVFDQKQADCVAPKWVKIIGVDTLHSKKVSPKDLEDTGFNFSDLGLSKDQATKMIDGVGSCKVDLYKKLLAVLETGLDKTKSACLEQNLDAATAKQVLIEAIYQSDPSSGLAARLQTLDEKCHLNDTTSTSSGSATASTVTTPDSVAPTTSTP